MAKWAQDDPPKRKITTLKFVWKINQIKGKNLIFFESERKRNYINLLIYLSKP